MNIWDIVQVETIFGKRHKNLINRSPDVQKLPNNVIEKLDRLTYGVKEGWANSFVDGEYLLTMEPIYDDDYFIVDFNIKEIKLRTTEIPHSQIW